MPSLSRGHLRIVLFASLVFRNSLKRNAFPLGEQRSGGASFGGNLRQSSEASQSVIHGSLFAVYWMRKTLFDAV